MSTEVMKEVSRDKLEDMRCILTRSRNPMVVFTGVLEDMKESAEAQKAIAINDVISMLDLIIDDQRLYESKHNHLNRWFFRLCTGFIVCQTNVTINLTNTGI